MNDRLGTVMSGSILRGVPRDGRKREAILVVAAERFGRFGFEDTRWADIAAEVGIGPTALYHYFESKLQCLFLIMEATVGDFRRSFDEVVATHESFEDGFCAVWRLNFSLSDADVSRCRALVAEQGRLAPPRRLEGEEEARQRALSGIRDLETAWSNYLVRGMAVGAIPESDPQLLAGALLGLYNSIWHWFRPREPLSLSEVEAFMAPRLRAVVGLGK